MGEKTLKAYCGTIREILATGYIVMAKDEYEAEELLQDAYINGDAYVNNDELVDTQFEVHEVNAEKYNHLPLLKNREESNEQA